MSDAKPESQGCLYQAHSHSIWHCFLSFLKSTLPDHNFPTYELRGNTCLSVFVPRKDLDQQDILDLTTSRTPRVSRCFLFVHPRGDTRWLQQADLGRQRPHAEYLALLLVCVADDGSSRAGQTAVASDLPEHPHPEVVSLCFKFYVYVPSRAKKVSRKCVFSSLFGP